MQAIRDVEDEQIRCLAAAVIRQAFDDLRKSKSIEVSLDAMMFLTGDDFPLWAEACGMPFAEFRLELVPMAWQKIRKMEYRSKDNGNIRRTKTATIAEARPNVTRGNGRTKQRANAEG